MEELWKVKDELSEMFGGDLQAYCDYLNRTALAEGFELVIGHGLPKQRWPRNRRNMELEKSEFTLGWVQG